MQRLSSLSVFFPCYNEVDNVGSLVERTPELVAELADEFEIIIIDDGSTDGTAELSDELAAQHSYVTAVHHETNQGYGAALQSGFDAARYEYIFFTDGDAQFDVTEITKLVELIHDVDMVIGWRRKRADSLIRSINAFAYRTMIRALFGLRVRDIDCAFKLIRRSAVDELELSSTGALISAELLIKAQRAGFTYRQVGVSHYPRQAGKQSGANISVILRMFRELWQLRGELRGSSD